MVVLGWLLIISFGFNAIICLYFSRKAIQEFRETGNKFILYFALYGIFMILASIAFMILGFKII